MSEAIRDFFRLFGQWLWVWVLTILFGLVTGILDVLGVASISPWLWGLALIIGLFLGPSYAYWETWKQAEGLRVRLQYRVWMMQVLSELASRRAVGVALRNQGLSHMQARQLTAWQSEVDTWHAELQAQAAELGEHESSLLETLNLFVGMYAPNVTSTTQQQTLDELNATLERLTEMIVDFRPILWQAQP